MRIALPIAALVSLTGCSELLAEPAVSPSNSSSGGLVFPVGVTATPATPVTSRSTDDTDAECACGSTPAAANASASRDAYDGEQYVDTDASALTQFRDVLDPFGTWDDDATLGTVWFPSRDAVGAAFVPYVTAGRWVQGDELIWMSDYAWGWAPFHYGRWAFTGARGWAWVPGRRYAGAWVDWRVADEHVGWAPTPPSWYWQSGQAFRVAPARAAAFVYAPADALFTPQIALHLLRAPEVFAIASRSRAFTAPPSALTATASPPLHALRVDDASVVRAPWGEPGLQRAWVLARPSTAETTGARPRLSSPPPRLPTWVAGAPTYVRPTRAMSSR